MNQPYNLDSEMSEYFEFILKDNVYRFRYPTTREASEAKDLENKSEKESRDFMMKFVTKVDENSPNFGDIIDDLSVKYWSRFIKMVTSELTSDDNQSPKST